jgi:type II secretory pathway pseudopilin PulG
LVWRLGDRPGAFSLLEIILVLAVIAIAAAIVLPVVNALFSSYEIERSAERLQGKIAQTRLRAIAARVPYAFVYLPETRHYAVCAIEPLTPQTGVINSSAAPATPANSFTVLNPYDRVQFQLAEELRFLAPDVNVASGLANAGSENSSVATASAAALESSGVLTAERATLAVPSARTVAALQISGLNAPGVSQALIFLPDGSTDDATVRIAHANGRYVELTVRGLTGSVQASRSMTIAELIQSGRLPGGTATTAELVPGPRLPGRETQSIPGVQ